MKGGLVEDIGHLGIDVDKRRAEHEGGREF
jgi:hypothetical protein